MELLRLEQVTKAYAKGKIQVTALHEVNLVIEQGEFLAIVGPSGSGKTTLLNIIGCLDTVTSGNVFFNGQELSGKDEKFLSLYRKNNLGFIFQSYNLILVLSVRENVELSLVIENTLAPREIRARAEEIIAKVGLGEKMDRFPNELSGGEEQRVAIARALVKEPLLVLADEPTANLDSQTSEEIIGLMQKMNREMKTTFVFSTHDWRVQRYASRVVTLKDGRIEADERR